MVAPDDALATTSDSAAETRLAALRIELRRRRLDGFVVPHADAHRGEFLAARDERLAWLTGFTGSAGTAVVLIDDAAMFVDGRYTLQAKAQVPGGLYRHRHLVREPVTDWLADALAKGQRLGFDPWLHSAEDAEKLAAACGRAGAEAVAVDDNPIDAIWTDQPPLPAAPATIHELAYAGKSSAEKRRTIATELEKAGAQAAVLTATESVAWLLNMRGADLPCVPVVLAFAVAHSDESVDLFIDPAKVDDALRTVFGDAVRIRPPQEFGAKLDGLGASGRRVLLDPQECPAWIRRRLEAAGAAVVVGRDPSALPRAIKNSVEIDGARRAHERDGAALCRFLAWLSAEATKGGVTEIAAAERLAAFRAEGALYKGPSFETISGAGPNGAIVHYRVTEASNRRLEPGTLYLVDSGGQYLDGTTDVTRTVAIGRPLPEKIRRFTQVLKGHIAIATAVFPKGTTGAQLDTLARQFLWRDGVDYDHGTGHGVGSYLRVHEGPQSISTRPNSTALAPGMIVSNEPGYYKIDAYGIRIENLVLVSEAMTPPAAERELLEFETLTLAPIDRALIDEALLTEDERTWLSAYHRRVLHTIGPLVDEETRRWLEIACQ